ncbi:Hormonally up-regulated neu tumor-associated kinase-like [Balamuthia mandrillaris]
MQTPFTVPVADDLCSLGLELCDNFHGIVAATFGVLCLIFLARLLQFPFDSKRRLLAKQCVLHVLLCVACGAFAGRYLLLSMFDAAMAQLSLCFQMFYFLPYLLIFSAVTLTTHMWLELYYMVVRRNKKRKLHRVATHTLIINGLVYLTTLFVFFNFEIQWTLLPLIIAVVLLFFKFWEEGIGKYKRNTDQLSKRATSSIVLRFATFTRKTAMVCASLMLTVTVVGIYLYLSSHITDDDSTSSQWISLFIISRFLTLRLLEVTLIVLHLNCLSSTATLTRQPLPVDPKNLSKEWLTTILQEERAIENTTYVASFLTKTLMGGCHYKVSKISLDFTGECVESSAPKTIVVKVLRWNHPLKKRLELELRRQTGLLNKEAMYLVSYQIESQFYSDIAANVRGFHLPKVYYNFEDCFNNCFGIVMQDINFAAMADGQPDGFTFEECMLCLKKLAEFHAAFWDHPRLQQMNVWELGGYWTGDKRRDHKLLVRSEWAKALRNFAHTKEWKSCLQPFSPTSSSSSLTDADTASTTNNNTSNNSTNSNSSIPLLPSSPASTSSAASSPTATASEPIKRNSLSRRDLTKLGERLERNLPKIMREFDDMPRRTLIHGDFKITNLFVDHSSCAEPSVWTIDWQWLGRGAGVVDAAYFVATSASLDCLTQRNLRHWIKKSYYRSLLHHGVTNYPFKQFWRQFMICFIDFFVYTVVSKWAYMTPEEVEKYYTTRKDGLHLRTLSHMRRLIELAEEFMTELEFF